MSAKKTTARQRSMLDQLAKALQDVPPERLQELLAKTETISMRVTAAEKADMQATAKLLALTLTEYLCKLHGLAVTILRRKADEQ